MKTILLVQEYRRSISNVEMEEILMKICHSEEKQLIEHDEITNFFDYDIFHPQTNKYELNSLNFIFEREKAKENKHTKTLFKKSNEM